MIIAPSELSALIGEPRVAVVDVRWYLSAPEQGRSEYVAGHIPTAVFCDLERDLTAEQGPGRHPLPRPEAFTATLRRLGLDSEDFIVAYDDSSGSIAARLWWMLRSIGHRQVAVLDGGFAAWVEEGHPVTQAVPRTKAGSYPTALDWVGVVDRSSVQFGHAPVIDVRAPERYRGDIEPIDPKPGHIPGAVNLPHAGNVDSRGRFLSRELLAARYADVGPDPIVYCGSGVTACHAVLAMTLAGRTDVRLYEGSWSDWSRQTDLPVATGGLP
jgi:thiosulfate/3-mercaptopyruvate sulfurtransferase